VFSVFPQAVPSEASRNSVINYIPFILTYFPGSDCGKYLLRMCTVGVLSDISVVTGFNKAVICCFRSF
jgi:hypothetical protein